MNAPTPDVGELALDTTRDRVGVLMACTGGTAWLRPTAGGREWTVPVTLVRPVTAAERLSARVATANARSRGEL